MNNVNPNFYSKKQIAHSFHRDKQIKIVRGVRHYIVFIIFGMRHISHKILLENKKTCNELIALLKKDAQYPLVNSSWSLQIINDTFWGLSLSCNTMRKERINTKLAHSFFLLIYLIQNYTIAYSSLASSLKA